MVVLQTDTELEDKRSGSGKNLQWCLEIDENCGEKYTYRTLIRPN